MRGCVGRQYSYQLHLEYKDTPVLNVSIVLPCSLNNNNRLVLLLIVLSLIVLLSIVPHMDSLLFLPIVPHTGFLLFSPLTGVYHVYRFT